MADFPTLSKHIHSEVLYGVYCGLLSFTHFLLRKKEGSEAFQNDIEGGPYTQNTKWMHSS